MSNLTARDLARIQATLPSPPAPAANYVPVREAVGFLFVAGQTPHVNGELRIRGIVGDTVSVEEAYSLAREAALNAISALQSHLRDLRELNAILSVTGYVAATQDFTQHPLVINGASDAFIECFGEAGRHARAAVGVQSLPDGAPVEISVTALRR